VIDLSSTRTWIGDNKYWFLQEKIDGSQLSFSVSPQHELTFYNKHTTLKDDPSFFRKSISMLNEIKEVFSPSFRYHGESVCSLRHNVVQYGRVPKYYFVLYDLQNEKTRQYLSVDEMEEEAKRTGLEHVQRLYQNDDEKVVPYEFMKTFLQGVESGEIRSMFGGEMEGVVLKHHAYVDSHGKRISTKLKYVTPKFQEIHQMKKPKEKICPEEFIAYLGSQFCTQPRFHKAVQHLGERSTLTGNFDSDILLLTEELDKDLTEECSVLIMNYLWTEFSPLIKKFIREQLSAWYKLHYDDLKTTNTTTTTKPTQKQSHTGIFKRKSPRIFN